jgi:hypothetical protein
MEDAHKIRAQGTTNTAATDVAVPPTSSCDSAESVHDVAQEWPKREADTSAVTFVHESGLTAESLTVPLLAWQICGDSVIGLAHRRKGLPCQDAVFFRNSPRPIIALSDGAGTAIISEQGAQALVIGITRFLMSMEDELSVWLDGDGDDDELQTQMKRWSERLRLHAHGLLSDLAQLERRKVSDLRATLQVAVVGERHIFWWKVGDGAIVAMDSEKMWALGNQTDTKGEFANQTFFVDTVSVNEVQSGLLSAQEIFGVALMSDGGSEKLVAHDGSKVANRLGEWFADVAEKRFSVDRIAIAFHEPVMWERTSLDDRSIIFAARSKQCQPVKTD